jgi:phosphatidylinositol alpha-1,6-mannosyltransferase
MRLLFISRAYPPVIGGIENQNHALSVWLPEVAETRTIANRHGKKALPWFLPFAFLKAALLLPRYDAVLLGDGVLAGVGAALKILFPKKTVFSIVHGLDLTYQSGLYQRWWVRRFLPALDGLIAVSEATRQEALARGLAPEKVQVIPNGIDPEDFADDFARSDLEALLDRSLDSVLVLVTAGRLTRRKGVLWFIEQVLPHLPENVLYVVAGDGPERERLERARNASPAKDRILLLGRVENHDRNVLLHTADIFVQPNIPVAGDMEGFGIAVIEAALCGRPVVASDLEGLRDALALGRNGILVSPEDPTAFVSALLPLLQSEAERQALGEQASRYTREHFAWPAIVKRYRQALEGSAPSGLY